MRLFSLIILSLSFLNLWGSEIGYKNALFAKIVPTKDALNLRVAPDKKSKKVFTIPHNKDLKMGVKKCKKVDLKSIWCKVFFYNPENSFKYKKEGWIDARFLKFLDKGYVLIDGKGECNYSIDCDGGYCSVITNYMEDNKGEIVSVSIKKINIKRLEGTTPNKTDCNLHLKIDKW